MENRMKRRQKVDDEIANARNEIRTDKLDISYGELAKGAGVKSALDSSEWLRRGGHPFFITIHRLLSPIFQIAFYPLSNNGNCSSSSSQVVPYGTPPGVQPAMHANVLSESLRSSFPSASALDFLRCDLGARLAFLEFGLEAAQSNQGRNDDWLRGLDMSEGFEDYFSLLQNTLSRINSEAFWESIPGK